MQTVDSDRSTGIIGRWSTCNRYFRQILRDDKNRIHFESSSGSSFYLVSKSEHRENTHNQCDCDKGLLFVMKVESSLEVSS